MKSSHQTLTLPFILTPPWQALGTGEHTIQRDYRRYLWSVSVVWAVAGVLWGALLALPLAHLFHANGTMAILLLVFTYALVLGVTLRVGAFMAFDALLKNQTRALSGSYASFFGPILVTAFVMMALPVILIGGAIAWSIAHHSAPYGLMLAGGMAALMVTTLLGLRARHPTAGKSS